MSLFGSYILEREGKGIVESDIGFATYKPLSDGMYIEDIYVSPDYRQTGEASRLADQIAEIAKEKGFHKLYGSVSPSAKGATSSLKVLLAYGFKLEGASQNFITMVKEI